MNQLRGSRLSAPSLSGNQHRDVRLREQLRLRTQPPRGRTRREEIQLVVDSFDFWLIHVQEW